LENFPQEWEVIPKARRLSLECNELNKLPRRFCAPDLLTLLLRENLIITLLGSFLWSCRKLRVLDLRFGKFDSLPKELGDLKDLVWLNLSWCVNLEILPDTVRKLHMLQCLNLSHSHTWKYLPSGVGGLPSLQVLNTRWCDCLRWVEHTIFGSCISNHQSFVGRHM
jgi:hypothetical protein